MSLNESIVEDAIKMVKTQIPEPPSPLTLHSSINSP